LQQTNTKSNHDPKPISPQSTTSKFNRPPSITQCVNIKDIHEGVDFFFSHRAHGMRFIDFLQSVVPARFRSDKQLVSHDEHTSSYNYKYTFSVEIAPVCKVGVIEGGGWLWLMLVLLVGWLWWGVVALDNTSK
jgi:NMD protein affecting ribosome stability and mRNA decay